VKALAWILTAAAVLIGADVFVMSTETDAQASATATVEEAPTTLQGGAGIPTPPTD
jgi:hypothetical protein